MGLEASCPISRLVMDAWADALIEKAQISEEHQRINPVKFEPLTLYMLEKYVDDVLTGQEEIKLGTKWNTKDQCLEWTNEQFEIDRAKDPQEVTMTAIAAMASSILSCLEFTWDAPYKNQTNKIPVLDTHVWVGTQIKE